jgi:hypothetical protein
MAHAALAPSRNEDVHRAGWPGSVSIGCEKIAW